MKITPMQLDEFIEKLDVDPNSIEFEDTMSIIENNYKYFPVSFINGNVNNHVGENEGSCKLLYFAQLNQLSEQQALNCFGKFYRDDVLNNPTADNHQNIRNFMQTGWDGIVFQGQALVVK